MWNFIAFGLIGLLVGAAARLLYPNRQPSQILATMALGVAGALAGWMISWAFFPEVDGHFEAGNLLVSVFGASLAIAFYAAVHYARSLGGFRKTSP